MSSRVLFNIFQLARKCQLGPLKSRISSQSIVSRTLHFDFHIERSSVAQKVAINYHQQRFKKKGRGKRQQEEQEDADEDNDDEDVAENPLLVEDPLAGLPKDYINLTIDAASLRLDSVCRAAFNISRSSIEEAFYKGNLRVNDQKPSKKSEDIHEGDVIDVIKGHNEDNHLLIDVSRVVIDRIPDLATASGRYKLEISRWDTLTIPPHESRDDDDDI